MGRPLLSSTPPPPPVHPSQPSLLDSKIWHACAGDSVQIPIVNSMVYYFPQGHIDQASSTPTNLSQYVYSTPYVFCRIVDVQLLADHNTDEVFVKLALQPVNRNSDFENHVPPTPPPPAIAGASSSSNNNNSSSGGEGNENDVVSYTKVLTPSDANNGGGFSVPRICAETIFPLLNFKEDPPFQNLRMTDVHGNVWEFRHIYRGTPRRHLLTSGWSNFVNFKKIVAGDSVVFMKNSKGEVFAGVRRAKKASTRSCDREGNDIDWCGIMLDADGPMKRDEDEEKKQEHDKVVKEEFLKGKLAPEKVAEAAELAAKGMAFEVVYYPSAVWCAFVVKAEIVDAAMTIRWNRGMRVKMAVETEDPSRISSFQGTVCAVIVPQNGPWQGSPWHMIQVAWDEPNALPDANFVNPWQVEPVSAAHTLCTAFSPLKRFRSDQDSVCLTNGIEYPFFPMTGYTNSTMGQLNQTLSTYGTFTPSMQGARHNLFSTNGVYNCPSDMGHLSLGNSFGTNAEPSLKSLSTELNIGSSKSENLAPDSQLTLHSCCTECVGTHNCNSKKPMPISIQLFGTTIKVEQAVERVVHITGCTGNDSCKCHNEIKGTDNLEESTEDK